MARVPARKVEAQDLNYWWRSRPAGGPREQALIRVAEKKHSLSNDLSIANAAWDSSDEPDVPAPGQRPQERLASAHVAGIPEAPRKLGLSANITQLPPGAGLLPTTRFICSPNAHVATMRG